jgi:hypothetical protein
VISRVNLAEGRQQPAQAELFHQRNDWIDAPSLFRLTAMIACLALVVRAVASALPGSRSGIETMIRRADAMSSLLSQLTVLLGGAQVVLLVVGTLNERSLSYAYRIAIVPASAAVLMLVMLASTMGLDLELSLVVGAAALVLAGSAGTISMQRAGSRAQGMVLIAITVASSVHLLSRVLALGLGQHQTFGSSRAPLLLAFARAADAVAMALLAVRLSAERGTVARIAVLVALAVASAVTWGALRGSLDGAALWQVVASRSLYELAGGSASLGGAAARYGIESFAVLLGGTVIFWPGRLSMGALSAALAVLARPSVDVPECALILTLAALSAPAVAPLRRSFVHSVPSGGSAEQRPVPGA